LVAQRWTRAVFMDQESGKLALAKPVSNGVIGSATSHDKTLQMSLVILFGTRYQLTEHGSHR